MAFNGIHSFSFSLSQKGLHGIHVTIGSGNSLESGRKAIIEATVVKVEEGNEGNSSSANAVTKVVKEVTVDGEGKVLFCSLFLSLSLSLS